jgi:hypothetical protein
MECVCLFVCWFVYLLVSQSVGQVLCFFFLFLCVGWLVSQSVRQLCLSVCLFAFG